MSDIKFIGFQRLCPNINLDLKNNNEKDYDMYILAAHLAELKNGFVVSKQYKTNKNGTKFTYKCCESKEEADEYKTKIDELLKNCLEKYY